MAVTRLGATPRVRVPEGSVGRVSNAASARRARRRASATTCFSSPATRRYRRYRLSFSFGSSRNGRVAPFSRTSRTSKRAAYAKNLRCSRSTRRYSSVSVAGARPRGKSSAVARRVGGNWRNTACWSQVREGRGATGGAVFRVWSPRWASAVPRAPPPPAPEGPAAWLDAWPGPDRGARFSASSRSRSRHRAKGDGGSRSCASTSARTRAATETGAARARFAGARIVPAAAPSRAASPHGAGGTCASASAPKTRFGNEGDNAIGRLGGGASSEGSSARGAGRGVLSSATVSTPSTTPDNPWRAPQGAMGTAGPSARRRLTVSSLLRHERARRWRASGRTRFREKRKFFFF